MDCTTNSQQIKCQDCEFMASNQGGLSVHRSKLHKTYMSEQYSSVSVVRLYPEGKQFYCCICNSIVGSFPNFHRHFKNLHPSININATAECVICGKSFETARGAGVHCRREHLVGTKVKYPHSPSPIISSIDFLDSQPPSGRKTRRSRRVSEASPNIL